MEIYRVEVGDDEVSRCACCNQNSLTGHGFVYRKNDAYAVYYAAWSTAHAEKKVSFAIAIGEWDDNSTSRNRVCFGVEAKESDNEVLFRVLEPKESPWPNTELLGAMIDRENALAHSSIGDVFSILEKVLRGHPSLNKYLMSSKSGSIVKVRM
jgi:hypothetical protein